MPQVICKKLLLGTLLITSFAHAAESALDSNYLRAQELYANNNLELARYEFSVSAGKNYNYTASTYYVAYISELLDDQVMAKANYHKLIIDDKTDKKFLQIALFRYARILLKQMQREEKYLEYNEKHLANLDLELKQDVPKYIYPLLDKAITINPNSALTAEIKQFRKSVEAELKLRPQLEIDKGQDNLQPVFSLNAFYASTFGTYSELTEEQTVETGQNFPVTLGIGGSLTNEEKKHSLVSSLYWAQASKGKISSNSESSSTEISTPSEVGANIYYQNYFQEAGYGLYAGYDFEKLNTLDTSAINTGGMVENIVNQIHYGTVGLTKNFTLFDLNFNLKTSFSKVLSASSSTSTPLDGQKYIVFLTYKPEGRFSFNAFYKHHDLTGTTELSIDRLGLSITFNIL